MAQKEDLPYGRAMAVNDDDDSETEQIEGMIAYHNNIGITQKVSQVKRSKESLDQLRNSPKSPYLLQNIATPKKKKQKSYF